MAEIKVNGDIRIMDGTTKLRTLKEINTELSNLINNKKILYSNGAGSVGNITLNDYITKFKYIEISGFANSNDNITYKTAFCNRFRRISGTYTYNLLANLYTGSTYEYLACENITLSETSKILTRSNATYFQVFGTTKGHAQFNITDVVGYVSES